MELDIMYDKAKAFIKEAHKGQKDKQGRPYIEHPLAVSQLARKEYLRDLEEHPVTHKATTVLIIGLLHDVIEDTNYTFDDLRKMGYNEEIITGVKALTHFKDEPYVDYVIRLSKHSLAKYVKLGDLVHNSDIRRSMYGKEPRPRTIKRLEKYFASYAFLKGNISKKEYRKIMSSISKGKKHG